MSATVTVRGTAVINAQPDEVELDLSVSYLDRTAEAALAEVIKRSATLEEILSELSIDRACWTTTGATVQEETEWNSKESKHIHRGYRATNCVHLLLTDPEPLGKLISAAVARSMAAIEGPTWSVALDNPARLDACRAAAENAAARAEAYVTALGARLGAIISISEPGTTIEPIRRDVVASPPMTMARMAPDMELGINAGEMEVRATVQVTYAIEQG
ncbi:MAG TPA: SIMPL domain-containing protein [Thermomicrobiales bacterium]|jgi:uncharacterized protein YggE|nr:hypothetical protein [Chloroflexota bacterium]HCG29244.1 hypothetical protein [Chloroflexota bacterium]HQX61971.1 SIMPL domain-containing protein [Thermomicrobiales bacterium]HQZ89400.1 SIMPL domain-containing protein [Thermomicrobiales bacterium]HRA30542.1 SIMPL domain-containing protein [Thermomicrobiales bacterium]